MQTTFVAIGASRVNNCWIMDIHVPLFNYRYPRINKESLLPIAKSLGPESAEG